MLDARMQCVVRALGRALVALGLAGATAAHALTQDITAQFAITGSLPAPVLNQATNTYDLKYVVRNVSGAPILGPVAVVVGGLPATVTLANRTGQWADGRPYVTPLPAGALVQNGALVPFTLKFANPQQVTFSSVLQFLYTIDVPADAPTLIAAVATGGTNARLVGRVNGATNQPIAVQASTATTCVLGTLVGGTNAGVPVATTTDGLGYFGVDVPGIGPGTFVTVKLTSPAATSASLCQVSSRDNDSWPKAFALDDANLSASDFIDSPGKARWYRFSITPGQRIQVTLSNLPADYDLAVFKDIGQAFLSQFDPANAKTNDLVKLAAEYAPSMFSPSMFSPSTFSPDAYSPSMFSPSMFSTSMSYPSILSAAEIQRAFSTAQTRSVIAVGATPGTGNESAVVNTWNSTGSFYVRVVGRKEAFSTSRPFQLDIVKGPTTCTGVTDTTLTPRPSVAASGRTTVILTDSSKVALDEALLIPGGGTLGDRLTAFAARPEVSGVVVDVANDTRVGQLKQQAANNPACPFAKNLVAEEIRGIVGAYRADPLRYVVIIGNDDAIPFFRSPDQSQLGEELGFIPPVQSNSPSEASLRKDFVLGQDEYGSRTTLSVPSSDFPVPGLAVGRLVETASEIAGVLDAYVASNGVVVPRSSLVTGYDFLADGAEAVRTELACGTGLGAPGCPPVAGASQDALMTANGVSPADPRPYAAGGPWTANDLRGKLLNARHDVIFLEDARPDLHQPRCRSVGHVSISIAEISSSRPRTTFAVGVPHRGQQNAWSEGRVSCASHVAQ